MLLIISLVVLILLLVSVAIITGHVSGDWDHSMFTIPIVVSFVCLIAFFVTSSIAVTNHVREDEYIYDKQQQRESLVDTFNQYQDEYDNDITNNARYQQIRVEINDFNSQLYSNKKWNKSVWIGWLYKNYSSIEPIQIIDGVAN